MKAFLQGLVVWSQAEFKETKSLLEIKYSQDAKGKVSINVHVVAPCYPTKSENQKREWNFADEMPLELVSLICCLSDT